MKKATRRVAFRNCPSWARTRTLLIQSQTCCQLHQGAADLTVSCCVLAENPSIRRDSEASRATGQRQPCAPLPHGALVLFIARLTGFATSLLRHARGRLIPLVSWPILAGAGCREAMGSARDGSGNVHPGGGVEELFAALGARAANPWRDPKYDGARFRIASAAFLPSRVWDDTSVWTASAISRRTLLVTGRFADGRYRLEAAQSLTPIAQPGDSRHVINLTRLSSDEYAWDTDVAYAIGHGSAADAARLVLTLFAAAEGKNERELCADYAAA